MTTCLHTLFEQQAELHPSLTAVKFQNTEISYKELNERSNRLANYLCTNGVKTGDKVSIYLKRSIEMLVGILGILKSGAAYGPIDPKLPAERLKFLLDDIDSQILVTNNDLWGEMTCKQKVVQLDRDQEIISKYSTNSPNIEIQDSNIAVILYTSGSTGHPKGVLLSHKSLVNRLIWDRGNYKHSINDIVLQHASYTFDFSILEIFMALANGGKLVLARPEFHYDGFYLIELIQKEKITKMGSVPSLLKAYINLPAFKKCTSLKQVFLGGETLHYDLQNTFFKKSSAELINIYGPTETSISVLHWTCENNSKDKIVPIGYPVANMKVYLLDENKEQVSDGDTGEIYIAGVGVASGYHNRPELTADCFLPDPFTKNNEARMYKTGDFGKKLPDGAIQFLGRKDYQIKARGLRIELQEIELHIISHDSVNTCVVAGVENKNREMKIVAYVIPNLGIDLNVDEIKTYLRSKLPDYMVPGFFIQMSEFPLFSNGKIDRNALPHPEDARLLSHLSYTAPSNETQRHLKRIWEKVLELKSIGITDSFNNIGGDSLASIEIHTMMETEMGCTLPISSFVNADTIQEQAKIIDADTKILYSSKLIHLGSSGEKTPIIFVGPIHSTGISSAMNLMKYIDPSHPFVVTPPFSEGSNNIPDSIEECARYYVKLIESQYPRDEYIVGGFSVGGHVAFEMASILQEKGKAVKSLFLVDTFHPIVIKNDRNKYRIRKRVFFYLQKLFVSNPENKKDIFKHLITISANAIKSLFQKGRKHPIFRQYQKVYGINTEKKMSGAENKIFSLLSRFTPSLYNGNLLLISAKNDNRSHFFSELANQKENVKKWTDDISGELFIYEIPGTHKSIMKEPNIKIVANIINDQVLNN